jgi:hypothetical protein
MRDVSAQGPWTSHEKLDRALVRAGKIEALEWVMDLWADGEHIGKRVVNRLRELREGGDG